MKALVADDELLALYNIKTIVSNNPLVDQVEAFSDSTKALDYAMNNDIDIAFLDIELRNMTGLDLCKELLKINPRTNVIYLTAYGGYSLDAWGTGASGFMLKPITAEGVREQLKHLRYPFRSGGEN